MRNSKIFQILFVVFVLGTVYWFGVRTDPKVEVLNQALNEIGSPALQSYPYTFRVKRLDAGVAVMATPRSFEVPVYRMIAAIYPNLAGKSPTDPDFIAAEKELAQMQSEARQIVLKQPGISAVKWELDQNWLLAHNISLN